MTEIEKFAKELATRTMTTTIGARSGEGQAVEWRAAEMPADALMRIFEYGAQRIFNDRVGGADSTIDQKVEAARKMVDAFRRGEIRRLAGSGGMSQDDKDLIAAVRALLDKDSRERLAALDRDEQIERCLAIRDRNPTAVDAQLKLIRAKRKPTSIDLDGIDL